MPTPRQSVEPHQVAVGLLVRGFTFERLSAPLDALLVAALRLVDAGQPAQQALAQIAELLAPRGRPVFKQVFDQEVARVQAEGGFIGFRVRRPDGPRGLLLESVDVDPQPSGGAQHDLLALGDDEVRIGGRLQPGFQRVPRHVDRFVQVVAGHFGV